MKYIFSLAVLSATFSFGQTPLDTTEEISVGGIRQFIAIETRDNTLPILLFLHGGPGGSVLGYAHRFTDKLKEHFIVVLWDQRETGRTLELNASPVPLSLDLFQNDTYEVINILLKKFNRKKLYLAGHSWGTALGFHIARNHPGLLYAYLPIGPMINQLESERVALAMMKDHALKKGDQKESGELALVHIPFETGEQLYYHRKWLQNFSGGRKSLSKSYVETWSRTWLHVFNEASNENLVETLPVVNCPVYFFAGRKDIQTNSGIAEQYFRVLEAPKKDFFWFENSGHSIPSSDPALLQQLIIEKVLPETFTIQKPSSLITTQ